jgi:tryptophan synthase alpha chain
MVSPGLNQRLRQRLSSIRAVVGIYLVPGFPDWATSVQALAASLDAGVDFVEFPIICEKDWSPRTGGVIARALEHAIDCSRLASRAAVWLGAVPRGVGIVYRSAWPEPDRWAAPEELLALASALLLEPDVESWDAYAAYAREWGLPLVPAVDGRDGRLSADERSRLRAGDVFAYLSLGGQTGSRDDRLDEAREKTALIREIRPDIPICAAFGIATPDDVREVLETVVCDGVVIGTAALEALEAGMPAYRSWLRSVIRAARRPVATR